MGARFCQKGLSLNIAGDESLRFEDNFLTTIGPSTLPFTTTLRALTPPLMTAFGDTVIEVQFRSPSICPLT